MNWNETLRNNVTRAEELRTYMRLTSQEEEHMTRILERFPMTVTRYYMSLSDKIRRHSLLHFPVPSRIRGKKSVPDSSDRGLPHRGGGKEHAERPGQMHPLRHVPCVRKNRNTRPPAGRPYAVQIPSGQIRQGQRTDIRKRPGPRPGLVRRRYLKPAIQNPAGT